MADKSEPTETVSTNVEQEKEKAWHEWMGIAVGLTGLLSVMAIILSFVALDNSGTGSSASAQAAPVAAVAPPPKAVPTQSVSISVKADDEHGRKGPDGKWHDAFLPADFSVHAGDKVTVTVTNYDGGPHSFTSPSMGVNETIPGGGSMTAPRTMTFTFTAPAKAGKYQWWCSVPCDPWAMARDGYMRGIVTVTA
jgi:plastocyanin